MGNRDPVAAVLGETEDLYDVAEWDARTVFDKLSLVVYAFLHATKRYGLIVLAIILFVVQLAFAGLIVVQEPSLGVLALLSAIPAFAIVAYVWYGDPTRREPILTLAITFVLAVLFASFAALINSVFQVVFGLIPVVGMALFFFLVVGPIEETVKWLAIRTHAYNTDEFDAVIDGAVYGAVAGLGFATIENALYITQGYLQAADTAGIGQLEQAVGTAAGRAFVGPGHVIYSAFAGYYLGLAKFNQENAGPIVVKGLLIAALLHASYNTIVTYMPLFVSGDVIPFIAFVIVFNVVIGYALYRKISRYSTYYDRASAQSPGERATDPADGSAGDSTDQSVNESASGLEDQPVDAPARGADDQPAREGDDQPARGADDQPAREGDDQPATDAESGAGDRPGDEPASERPDHSTEDDAE